MKIGQRVIIQHGNFKGKFGTVRTIGKLRTVWVQPDGEGIKVQYANSQVTKI